MEGTGAAEVGWDESAWKRSAKKGPLGAVSLFLFFSGLGSLHCLGCFYGWRGTLACRSLLRLKYWADP